ncbi:MAG TPA: DUF2142 domain-containing protein [Solirubrobacteraceae bacterium]|nr:DUF2142 domain-containing protein [Solirubrobacteraceae bacterium]
MMFLLSKTDMRVRIAVGVGLALIVAGVGLALSRAPTTVLHSNSIPNENLLTNVTADQTEICQTGELLPRGATAIRFSLLGIIAPSIAVSVTDGSAGSRLLTSGKLNAGWMAGGGETVPLKPLSRSFSNATICLTFGELTGESLTVLGQPASSASAVIDNTGAGAFVPLGGRLRMDYLQPGQRSWGSLAATVLRRIGVGRAWDGAWTAILVLASIAAVIVLTCWWTLRMLGDPGRRLDPAPEPTPGSGAPLGARPLGTRRRLRRMIGPIPSGARVCALIAFLSAAGWSILSPPFQVIDEPDHFAYAQHLAETGSAPTSPPSSFYSSEEQTAIRDLGHFLVRRHPESPIVYTAAELVKLRWDLAARQARGDGRFAGTATSEPPLYYALETIPYHLASGGSVLARLQAMRLLSALMAAVTALFAFLFVREVVPREPWAWAVGGLGVALQPLLGEISGGVNPDALLYAVSAALLYCLARGFRRGLTRGLALATGGVIALGLLSKLNFVGVLPGAVVGLIVLLFRALRAAERPAWRSLALAMTAAALPVGGYVIFSGSTSTVGDLVAHSLTPSYSSSSLLDELSHIWQLFMPRLPGMANHFPGIDTTRTIWLDGLVGLYGWIDTTFPRWVYQLALLPIGLITALCLRTLLIERAALRRRASELAVYTLITAGMMAVIGAASYVFFLQQSGPYQQVRYLFPLLALLGVVLALAARGGGRRWGPVAGALIIMLILAHDVFSQLLVAARYYG